MLPTQMRQEILEIPTAVARLLEGGAPGIQAAAAALRAHDPQFLISVARGSSDHVASYLKYASELLMGRAMASIGPSIASIYDRPLNLKGSACLTVSQSGKSPDIVAMTQAARTGGSLTIAMTNTPDSPLAQVADHTLNLCAGPELSVAATKTFVNSAVAGIWLLAESADDDGLRRAIHDLPDTLEAAVRVDWSPVSAALGAHTSVFCLGRGPAYAIANEAALKFKDVSNPRRILFFGRSSAWSGRDCGWRFSGDRTSFARQIRTGFGAGGGRIGGQRGACFWHVGLAGQSHAIAGRAYGASPHGSYRVDRQFLCNGRTDRHGARD